ncbi:Brr6p [Rhodotorula paludigena]|uniref:Brr6p n=1 Tax=Rhodotorula paludigena TaxID=86838 RepID=UPI003181B2C4
MRRFPAPPSNGGPATPGPAASRSAEAPMQYEWEQPRQFPTSPFQTMGADGEPARKRPHHEAMDVDTPPRPPVSFPPSATTSTLFSPPPAPPAFSAPPHQPAFDAQAFQAREAFGLQDEPEGQEVSMTADSEADVLPSADEADEKGEDLAVAVRGPSARRRNVSGTRRRRKSAQRSTDDEATEEDEDDERDDNGFLGVLKSKVGRRAGEFNFQVHHHHAPPSFSPGPLGGAQEQPERWMRRSTPYVLLGYLQFGSLTLLALLVLSLLSLFLYTLYTDIVARLAELTVELRSEVVQCAKKFMDNGCAAVTRFPALEKSCNEWEECMHREVVVVGKTRVVAETLAEVVNGFVEVISFKTMLFVLLTLGITIYGSSTALSILASRAPSAAPAAPSPSAHHHYPSPPPGYPAYGLPYGANGNGGAPWVIESGGCRDEGAAKVMKGLGVGAPPGTGEAKEARRAS